MANCEVHKGTKAVLLLNGKNYCEACKKQIETAQSQVSRHVEPKDCFIWYANAAKGWQPIPGTGCAHYVAHKFGIRKGSRDAQCMQGFPFRVADAISGKREVKLEDVQEDDLYVTADQRHMGFVAKIEKPKKEGDPPTITIEHDSSEQGKVARDNFAIRFHSSGKFFR